MKEQQLLMVTTLIMDFQGAKVVTQVKEMLSFSHTILPHVPMSLCDISLSSYIFHAVGPLVDPFLSHISRSLLKGLP